MIVFHGSRDEIKTALSLDHVGKGMGSNQNGYGFFSAREISTAYMTKERISEPRWSYGGDAAALARHCPDLSARLMGSLDETEIIAR